MSHKTVIFFSPHQDDELLSMGVEICKFVKAGDTVHVVLCTDGSKSSVKTKLNDGKTCSKHEGRHTFNLTKEAFINARDNEFMRSASSLGITNENIHIYQHRPEDGSLSVSKAEEIIKYYLRIDKNAIVCTLSSNNGKKQHPDHKALGQAAEKLFREKKINELHLFIEPYHFDDVKDNPRMIPVEPTVSYAANGIAKQINDAIKQYSIWDPEKGMYAIGFHSVTHEFEEYKNNMCNYYFKKKKRNQMTVGDKIEERYRKWLKIQKQTYYFYSHGSITEKPDTGIMEFRHYDLSHKAEYISFCQEYNYPFREKDIERFEEGSQFYALTSSDKNVVSTGWLAFKQKFYISELDYSFLMDKSDTGILYDFNTRSKYRGNGYYGLLLKCILNEADYVKCFMIYTSPDNSSSYKGILKAGFIHDGDFSSKDKTIKKYLLQHKFYCFKRKYNCYGMIINNKI